ncbi:MAG: hypothetical protein JO127_04640 [Caulobacteraceae bacterium]|nr:hypothetical protein [Caulobacteraceae bacterium]
MRPWLALALTALTAGGAFAPPAPAAAPSATGPCGPTAGDAMTLADCPAGEPVAGPRARIVGFLPTQKNGDGSFTRSFLLEIDAPYVPGNIAVSARGQTVSAVRIEATGVSPQGRDDDGWFYAVVSMPFGKYKVDVATRDESAPVELKVRFNVR